MTSDMIVILPVFNKRSVSIVDRENLHEPPYECEATISVLEGYTNLPNPIHIVELVAKRVPQRRVKVLLLVLRRYG